MTEQERSYWRSQHLQTPPTLKSHSPDWSGRDHSSDLTEQAAPTSLADTIPLVIHMLDPTQLFLGDDTDMSTCSDMTSSSSSSSSQRVAGTSSSREVPDKALLESKVRWTYRTS